MKYQGIFDSHAHYDDPAFDDDRDSLLTRIHGEEGVKWICNIGADLKSSRRGVELARQYPFFYAAVGVHPQEVGSYTKEGERELMALAGDSKVVAIGEIGLDYHGNFPVKEMQQTVFRAQLHLAAELGLPVVIHSREAVEDTLRIVKEIRPKGIVHCYSGSAEVAKEYVKWGLYLGFTGVATFKNARKVLEALKVVPVERILLETDCPYMAPEPYRGKRCDSSMIPETAKKIAEIKGIKPQQLIDQAAENARRVYHI